MRKTLLLLFINLCITFPALAGVLKGRITNAHGEALPYATVYIQGTTNGVSSSADGNYELLLTKGSYKVVCQFIGYRQSVYTVTISDDKIVTHNFTLEDQSLQMKEVVVHASGEDPAYSIIRKVIARRKFHLEQIRSFETGIYLKGVMRTRKLPSQLLGQPLNAADLGLDTGGKGILWLCEEDASYYTQGNKERTIIHSVRQSGDPDGYGFSRFPSVVDYYQNNVNLVTSNPRGFISPISDNALNFYRYKLQGTFTEDGHTIDKIQVIPKREYEPVFTGDIYIVEDDWAIHSLDLFVTKKSNLDVLDTVGVKQVFVPLHQDAWVAQSQLIYFSVSLLGAEAVCSLATVYDHQTINGPVPDTIFNNKLISSYDAGANKKDTGYWQAARPIPLEKDEVKDYKVKDSMMQRINSPAYKDSLRKVGNELKIISLLGTGYEYKSETSKNEYTLNPILLGMINYNIVEGVNVAPKLNWRHRIDTGKYLQGAVAARYGFSNEHFNAIGRLEYLCEDNNWKGRSWLMGLQGGKYVFQYNAADPVLPLFNSVSALLWRENDLRLYERWDATAYVHRNYGNGFSWDVRLSWQQRLPLENTTNFSFYHDVVDSFGPNLPAHLAQVTVWEKNNAALMHLGIAYQPGYKYTQYPSYKTGSSDLPTFSLTYDKGAPDILGSKSNFDKWRFAAEGTARLKLAGALSYNIAAGGFLNSAYVSVPDLMHLYGNRGIGFASPYLHSFQFMQYYDFSNIAPIYGEAHLEYNLQGLLSNKIPLLKAARWYLVVGTNTFYAASNNYYTEAFIGVDNLGVKMFRFLRVDFVQSWDSYGGHNSGIRFGINTNGLIHIKLSDQSGEW